MKICSKSPFIIKKLRFFDTLLTIFPPLPSTIDFASALLIFFNFPVNINILLEKIYSYLSSLEPKETSLITSERQILNSTKALNALKRIKKLSINEETELIAEELRLASKHISNITSFIDNEDVLDKIFSSFCIGK